MYVLAEISAISKMLLLILVLFIMQALGGYYQVKNYQRNVREIHKLGNVGLGQKKGKFFNGNIVMIAADRDGVIQKAIILDGITFLAKFHPVEEFLGQKLEGNNIYTFLEITDAFTKKERKKYLGWVRAFEALRSRFEREAEEAEAAANAAAEEAVEAESEAAELAEVCADPGEN